MACNLSTSFNGFKFTYLADISNPNIGKFCYQVENNSPYNAEDLSDWVLEVCPEHPEYFINYIEIESCLVNPPQEGSGCSKKTMNTPGSVPLIGVKFDYQIAKGTEPSTLPSLATFCVTFDTPLELGQVHVGFKAGTNTYVSTETICGPVCTGIKGLG